MDPRKMNRGQRVVLVIGLGAVLWSIPMIAWNDSPEFGWVAYAPLVRAGGTDWSRFILWVAVTLLWVGLSFAILRDRASDS